MLFPMQQHLTSALCEVRECNAYSSRFGLILREDEIAELVQGREEALRASGRIEFGGGILPKLIRAFCDSPFIERENYAAVLYELQEMFYYFKTESKDTLSDDEPIEFMVKTFNGLDGAGTGKASAQLGSLYLRQFAYNGQICNGVCVFACTEPSAAAGSGA